ncbi:MAG: hypothetical protein MJ201_04435, partial [Mycoplasmoidaceae bacterium]|nr:hypothetical protein [Mycoplasmoidaceae bacterium]
FAYQIKLAELSKMASAKSLDVSKDSELIVYVYNASGMSQRIYPSNPSDIYLNNQNIEHK